MKKDNDGEPENHWKGNVDKRDIISSESSGMEMSWLRSKLILKQALGKICSHIVAS